MRIGPKEKIIKAVELLERAEYLLDSVVAADPDEISVFNKGKLNVFMHAVKEQRQKIEVMLDKLRGV